MNRLLATLDQRPEFLEHMTRQIRRIDESIQKQEFFKIASNSVVLSPPEAGKYFSNCIVAVEALFFPHINSFSSTRWFYYLRRMPNAIFSGSLGTTLANARALSEIYALQSECVEEPSRYGSEFVFKVDESLLRHLARYMAFIEVIYDCQVGYRLSGKGQCYTFSHRRREFAFLPAKIFNKVVKEAVALYDRRHDIPFQTKAATRIVARLDGGAYDDESASTNPLTCTLWNVTDEQFERVSKLLGSALKDYSDVFPTDGWIRLQYGPYKIRLDILFSPYLNGPLEDFLPPEDAIYAILFLRLAGILLDSLGYSQVRMAEVGYFVVEKEEWYKFGAAKYASARADISKLIPRMDIEIEFEGFLNRIINIQAKSWPLRHGSPYREVSDTVYLDLASATSTFLTGYTHPAEGGGIANARALRFEDEVQRRINKTCVCPDEYALSLRQKPLRTNEGKILTDIDAVAVHGETLIVISCKSIIYSSAYDKGDYTVVRNAESTIVDGVSRWDIVVSELKNNPIGKNFDFSRYSNIVGILITPFVIYTSEPSALREVFPKLFVVCSIDEFEDWIDRNY